jgi:transposase
MSRALSNDLRQRVVAAVTGGMSRRQAAERFGVSAASAVRWAMLAAATGRVEPKKRGGRQHASPIEAHADFIRGVVEREADITLKELQAELEAQRGLHVGLGTLWRFFERHHITRKKRRPTPRSRTARTS